jgi:hypothetical protein
VSAKPGAPPVDDPYGKALGQALNGAVFGCLFVGIVSGLLGAWPLFFAFPAATVFLVLSALLAGVATAMFASHRQNPLSALAIMTIAASLTAVLFSALPLYFVLLAPGRAGGLLFG